MVSNLYTLTTILYPYNHSVFSLSVPYSVNYLKYSTFCYKIGFISPIGYCKFSENIWCFQIVVLEKTLETPLDCKKIKPVNPKESQLWIFIGRTEAEAPILWPPNVKSWLTGKDPDAGKDWRQEEKGTTESEMAGWHHQLNRHEFEQALGNGERQGSLTCISPWSRKYSDMTDQLNCTLSLIN